MQRKIAIGIFIVLFLSILAIIFHKKFINSNPTNTEKAANLDQDKTLILPVPFKSSNVLNTWVAYAFRGPVKEFGKSTVDENSFRLVMDTDNKSIPVFLTNDRTLVFKVVDGKQIPADFSDIQVGQQVDVYTSYSSNNSWSVGRIIILPDQTTTHQGD